MKMKNKLTLVFSLAYLFLSPFLNPLFAKEDSPLFKAYVLSRLYLNHPLYPKGPKVNLCLQKNHLLLLKKKQTLLKDAEEKRLLDMKIDFFIKYKGVKQTKGERPLLQLNYMAREAEISEGFEASENLRGHFNITKNLKVLSYVAVFEKWEDEKIYFGELDPLTLDRDLLYKTKVTASIKYAIGCTYTQKIGSTKKISYDFFLQQKANRSWDYQEKNFNNGVFSGNLFDHWIATLNLHF